MKTGAVLEQRLEERENMPDVVRLGSPVLFRALCGWMTALPRASPPKT
ncbi:hypothetical protein PC128_g15400 [Phytophthora cactorum]|nr:hypothetical protein PC128_g15400 [Phytophthora cactorum]